MARRDERGVVLPITIIMLAAVVAAAALVIDLGGDRVVRRDMQAVADVVALDVVRALDGRVASGYPGYSATGPSATLLVDAKKETLSRQRSIVSVDPDRVKIQLMMVNKVTGEAPRPATAGEVPNAVRAVAASNSAFRIVPTDPDNTNTNIGAAALAMRGQPIACISAGATFLDVKPQGPLDTMLGKIVGVDRLTVLDPYGLAALDLEIPLIDLAAKLGVGSVEEILEAEVTAHDFVIAISDVLPHKGNSSSVAILDAIVNGLPDTTNLDIGEFLHLDTGGTSAANLAINTFTLVQAVIMVANKETGNFVNISSSVSAPGLAKIDLKAKVIEPPQIACGPVDPPQTARSAQIELRLSADVKAVVAETSIDPLFITVAEGTGTITDIQCFSEPKTMSVAATTAVGKLGLRVLTEVKVLLITADLEIAAPDPAVRPGGASIGSTSSQTLNFTFPANDLPLGQTAGTQFGNLGLSSLTPIKLNAVGLPLGGLLGSVVTPLLGTIDPLVSNLLRPVLAEIGASVGTVRIQPTGRPSCNEAYLRQ